MPSGIGRGLARNGSRFILSLILGAGLCALAQTQDAAQPATQSAPTAEKPAAPPEASAATAGAAPNASTNVTDKASKPATAVPSSADLRLGPGDLVEVNVYGVPELTTKVRVNNSGDLYLPLINYVHVAELSLEESQKLIEKRLEDGGFVRDPHVSIFIDEFSSHGVSMLGEIARPGVYPVLGERRLLDMITAAGGLTDKAGRKVAITHRDHPDKPEMVELSRNLTDNPESNVPIQPGDIIEVHRAPIIYVVGDVGRPSGLLIDSGKLTVLQALALAGGPNKTAKLNGSRIIRKSDGPNGMTEMPVQLKKMLEAKTPDLQLQANDILFVPISGAKVAASSTLQAAMAVTTSLAIYAVHP